MKTRGLRRVSDTIEVVEYTVPKALKIAKWLVKQGADSVPMLTDADGQLCLADEIGLPRRVGDFVGFGDVRVDGKAPGDVAVNRVLWFAGSAFQDGKVVLNGAARERGGLIQSTDARLTHGWEEVV